MPTRTQLVLVDKFRFPALHALLDLNKADMGQLIRMRLSRPRTQLPHHLVYGHMILLSILSLSPPLQLYVSKL